MHETPAGPAYVPDPRFYFYHATSRTVMRIGKPRAIFTIGKEMCGAKTNVNQHGPALHQAIIILNARCQARSANHDSDVHAVSKSLDSTYGGGYRSAADRRVSRACIRAV